MYILTWVVHTAPFLIVAVVGYLLRLVLGSHKESTLLGGVISISVTGIVAAFFFWLSARMPVANVSWSGDMVFYRTSDLSLEEYVKSLGVSTLLVGWVGGGIGTGLAQMKRSESQGRVDR